MESQVQEIKDKLSINEVVGQYVQLKKAGRNYTARCPFHKEKTPSFMVSPERGTYICFGCGEKGDIFSFVQKIDGIDFAAALRQLADKAGVTLKRGFIETSEHKEKHERLEEVCEAATLFFASKLSARPDITEYLHSRGVLAETGIAWRLGYAPAQWRTLTEHLVSLGFTKEEVVEAGLAIRAEKKNPGDTEERIYDRFRGRIMFPISDVSGKVIAFSGRFYEEMKGMPQRPAHERSEPAKYVNSPETALFKKSRVLYGLDKAKQMIRRLDCVLLVEGQFDVVMSHQSGLPFAVALSGTALTAEHLSLMGRFSKRLVLALDADAAGLRSGLRSCEMALAAGFDVKVPAFPEGKDPADMAKENPELLKAAVRTSKTAIEFFLDAMRRTLPPGREGDERAYVKLVEASVLPLVAAVQSTIEREHFIQLVASRLHVPESAVRTEVSKRPVLPPTIESSEAPIVLPRTQVSVSPLEKKIGMLLFRFGRESDMGTRLVDLVGLERLGEIEQSLEAQSDLLQFAFDREVGEHAEVSAVAGDMLRDIERTLTTEALALAGGDTKRIQELARRLEELRQ